MALEQITDHVARGLARVITQFRSSQDVAAWVGALASEIQVLDSAIFNLGLALRDPTYAANNTKTSTLALLGRLVDAPARGTLAANDFRRLIQAQALANRSQGVVDGPVSVCHELLAAYLGPVLEVLDADDPGLGSYQSGPNTLVIAHEYSSGQTVSLELARNAMTLVKQATPAGSRTIVIMAVYPCNDLDPIFMLDGTNTDGAEGLLCAFDSPNTVR